MLGTIGVLGLAAPAVAADPYVISAPTITGTAVVGGTLNATGGSAGGPSGTVTGRQWLRCTNPVNEGDCDILEDQQAMSYKLTSADLGKRIRVSMFAYKRYPWDLVWKTSAATAAVGPAPIPTPTKPPV